jgi:hypothetical protein
MPDRPGGDHLGIEQRASRQQAMEEPAVPVGDRRRANHPRSRIRRLNGGPRNGTISTAQPEIFSVERLCALL